MKPTKLSEFHKFWDLLDKELLIKVPRELDSHVEVYPDAMYSATFTELKDQEPPAQNWHDQNVLPP